MRTALDRAADYMRRERRPYALLMKKDTVAPVALGRAGVPLPRRHCAPRSFESNGEKPSRSEAIAAIIERTPVASTVVLATTGFAGRELFALNDRPNQLYMVGSMGCVAALALGLSLARPDLRVVAVDGDGAGLMRMGSFATLGAYGAANLIHVLLDNAAHESTGGQSTVSPGVSFAGVAAACGYGWAGEANSLAGIDEVFSASGEGPRFLHLRIRRGVPDQLPRPNTTPVQVCERLMRHIGAR
jgi:phosphonopyruvate decarboxylase